MKRSLDAPDYEMTFLQIFLISNMKSEMKNLANMKQFCMEYIDILFGCVEVICFNDERCAFIYRSHGFEICFQLHKTLYPKIYLKGHAILKKLKNLFIEYADELREEIGVMLRDSLKLKYFFDGPEEKSTTRPIMFLSEIKPEKQNLESIKTFCKEYIKILFGIVEVEFDEKMCTFIYKSHICKISFGLHERLRKISFTGVSLESRLGGVFVDNQLALMKSLETMHKRLTVLEKMS
jgi:hypothetical protein